MKSVVVFFLTAQGLLFCTAHWLPSGHFVDLSRPYNNRTIFWPGGEPFGFTRQTAGYIPPNNYWYAGNDFKTAEHCGTHLDAPYHFSVNGWKVADIPLERLITTGILVNASKETDGNPNYKLPVDKLKQWEKSYGPIPRNSVVLVSFGWGSRYNDREKYVGKGDEHSYPGLSKEAAEWLVNTQRVVGVGVDTLSMDQGKNNDAHIILLGANLYGLENVDLTEPLPPIFKIIVLPMKISAGTGAPCRIVAIH